MKGIPQSAADEVFAFSQLVKRHCKVFLKDRMAVFFSLLAPIIVFLLYVLFLGDLQEDTVLSFFPEGVPVPEGAVSAFVDSWMISGVLGTACFTVSFSANSIMVQDKCRGQIRDCLVSPVKRGTVTLAYFAFNFLVTVIVVTLVCLLCFVYLAATDGFMMTAASAFGVLGNVAYSALSSTLFSVLVCSLFRTEGALSGFVGIVSAAIGFLIGAYMPLSAFPEGVQYFAALLPGTHSAGIFRNLLMSGALDSLTAGLPEEAYTGISEAFSMRLDMFGAEVGADMMAVYIACSVAVFAVLNVMVGSKLLDLSSNGGGKVSFKKKTKK